jgi:membrane-bound transcription factor site-1 protease
VTSAERVWGQGIDGACVKQSGTSVASPVVAGAVALLASIAKPARLNPATAKQLLHAMAQRSGWGSTVPS